MRLFLTLFGVVLFLSNCSEDFQLTEPWKDIPVVYGFINRADSAQYVRVEKLFVDENIPAAVLAKNPDSVYYKNAIVKLLNITKNKEYTLQKVDISLEGYPRNPGDFGQFPNFIYKILTKDIMLSSGDSILFKLERGDNKPVVTSRIKLIKDFSLTSPAKDIREITFKPGFSQSFVWEKTPESGIYSFSLIINVLETDRSINKTTLKALKWDLIKDGLDNRSTVSGDNFLNFLKENLEVNLKYQRQLLDAEALVRAGGIELKSFNLLVNANTGITASQEIPRFTNLSEGFGLFSNIHEIRRVFGISGSTLEAIRESEITKLLGF